MQGSGTRRPCFRWPHNLNKLVPGTIKWQCSNHCPIFHRQPFPFQTSEQEQLLMPHAAVVWRCHEQLNNRFQKLNSPVSDTKHEMSEQYTTSCQSRPHQWDLIKRCQLIVSPTEQQSRLPAGDEQRRKVSLPEILDEVAKNLGLPGQTQITLIPLENRHTGVWP